MPLSAKWQAFIDEYGSQRAYWYFPKGATADTDDFREKFRVFDLFEGEDWTPDVSTRSPRSCGPKGFPEAGTRFRDRLSECSRTWGFVGSRITNPSA